MEIDKENRKLIDLNNKILKVFVEFRANVKNGVNLL